MTNTAEDRILDAGYEDVMLFSDFSYDTALVGVTHDNRAVYDYDKMIEWIIAHEGWTAEEAIEWIEYNTIRALPYYGSQAPIIMTTLD